MREKLCVVEVSLSLSTLALGPYIIRGGVRAPSAGGIQKLRNRLTVSSNPALATAPF